MSMILVLFVLVLVACLGFWIVSILPLPDQPPKLAKTVRPVLYILLALLCICVLLDLIGWVDIGIHRHAVR